MNAMVKTHPLFTQAQILRDIRLSLQGGHREDRGAPPPNPAPAAVLSEEQRRRLEQEGYQRGWEAASALCNQRVAETRAQLEEKHRREVGALLDGIANRVQHAMERNYESVEASLIPFATEAVVKIVNHLPITVESIEANLQDTLGRVRANSTTRVLLHPEDLLILETAAQGDVSASFLARGLKLEGDAGVERGGCLVETDFGMVDGRRSTRIAAFTKLMA